MKKISLNDHSENNLTKIMEEAQKASMNLDFTCEKCGYHPPKESQDIINRAINSRGDRGLDWTCGKCNAEYHMDWRTGAVYIGTITEGGVVRKI